MLLLLLILCKKWVSWRLWIVEQSRLENVCLHFLWLVEKKTWTYFFDDYNIVKFHRFENPFFCLKIFRENGLLIPEAIIKKLSGMPTRGQWSIKVPKTFFLNYYKPNFPTLLKLPYFKPVFQLSSIWAPRCTTDPRRGLLALLRRITKELISGLRDPSFARSIFLRHLFVYCSCFPDQHDFF